MEGASFAGARKLTNGGVVFDCRDDTTSNWIQKKDIMEQFLAALGGTCVHKPRRVELIAEMVPIELRIEDAGTWRVIEKDGGFIEGGIAGARWVKAPHRRAPGQQVAHLKIEFAEAESANHAIDNGFYYQGRHYDVRKDKREPRRCAKCQKYDGHLAHACRSEVDVCGRCAENHRTADCPVTDSGTFSCSNCKVSGHGAVDRACPVFCKEQQRLRERDPTAGYRYIPTNDPRTW
ncbi:hypothetical protein C8R47DRAFT_981202, partial [Mycena vitilis]